MNNDPDVSPKRHILVENLNLAREAKGLTITRLAELSGIARQNLSVTCGGTRDLRLNTLSAISYALEIPPYALSNPKMIHTWDFSDNAEWRAYKSLIRDALPISLERKIIAQNIKALRIRAGLSIDRLEALSGTHPNTVSMLERMTQNIRFDKLCKVIKTINTPPHDIFNPYLIDKPQINLTTELFL